MRFIPKNTKVKMTFYKSLTVADIAIGFVGLILVCLAVASNLPYKFLIAFAIGIALIPFYFTLNGERCYKLFVHLFQHMARQKKYVKAASGKADMENIVPYNRVLASGVIENKDGSFAGLIEVKPVDLRMMSEDKQNELIDGVFARVLSGAANGLGIDLIKIERPLILDNYIADEMQRISELAESREREELSEREYASRADAVQNRMEIVDEINSREQINYSRYYLVLYGANKSELESALSRAVVTMQAGGMCAKTLMRPEIAAFLRYSIDNAFDERNLNVSTPDEYLSPKMLRFAVSNTKQDGKTLTHFAINEYPLAVPNGWGEGLFDMEHTKVVMKLKAVEKYKAVKRIDNALIEIATQNARQKASEMLDRETHVDSLQELLVQLQNDNATLFDTTIIVTAYDAPGKNAVKKAVRRRLKEMGFGFTELTGRQQDAWLTSQIYPIDKLNISRGIPTGSVAACFPFVSNAIADDKGLLIGENKLPVFVDFFRRDNEHVNSNMVIVGKPGSGKSFAAKSIIAQLASCNTKVYILDPENEYTRLAESFGGKVLDVSSAKYGKINPFHIIATEDTENDDGSDNDFFSHLQFLEEFYRTVLVGINSDSLELLNKVTQELYGKFGITARTKIKKLAPADYPIFDDLAALIDEKTKTEADEYNRGCYKVLANYIAKFRDGGRYSNLWNGVTSFAPRENFVVFSFQKLLANKNGVVANAQMLLVLKWLENEVIRNKDYNAAHGTNRRIVVAIDEAHVFIDERFPAALDFMFTLAKRIRKYAGMLIIITQNLKDFAGTPDIARKSMAIINVSQYSLIFALSPNDMTDLCNLYEHAGRINQAECENIVHNGRGTAFFISSP